MSVKTVSTDTDEQDAFFCLSMVACFLRMNPSADNLQSLKKSVCSDIYFGYKFEKNWKYWHIWFINFTATAYIINANNIMDISIIIQVFR